MRRSGSASGKRRPSIRLVVRAIEFDEPDAWLSDSSRLDPLGLSLEVSGLPSDSLKSKSVTGKAVVLEGWSKLAGWLKKGGLDLYQIESEKTSPSFKLKLNLTEVSIGLECELPVESESIGEIRKMLDGILEALHGGYCGQARIGPVLAITLRNLPYSRPRNPREDPQWPPGATTLGACKRFFESKGAEGRQRFKVLSSHPLPSGLTRRSVADLLIIETQATEGSALKAQRSELEKWIGEALNLSLDEEFNEHGDKQVIVLEREKAGQLGFYDSATKVLYKSAPELKNDDLDSGTLKRIEKILAMEKLPDGRKILGKRIVFVGKSAALRWSPWVSERGGSVAYLGTDGELWEPAL